MDKDGKIGSRTDLTFSTILMKTWSEWGFGKVNPWWRTRATSETPARSGSRAGDSGCTATARRTSPGLHSATGQWIEKHIIHTFDLLWWARQCSITVVLTGVLDTAWLMCLICLNNSTLGLVYAFIFTAIICQPSLFLTHIRMKAFALSCLVPDQIQ